MAACALAGCGGSAAKGSRPASLAQLNACFADAGAGKATKASDLSFAAPDIARVNYANAGSARVAGTNVYVVESTYHPGYALFMVAKPGAPGEPNISTAISDPSSVAGIYFVKGDNPDINAARGCLEPAA